MAKKEKKKKWETENEKAEKIADNEQTLANLIVLSFIWMIFFKVMAGTF